MIKDIDDLEKEYIKAKKAYFYADELYDDAKEKMQAYKKAFYNAQKAYLKAKRVKT